MRRHPQQVEVPLLKPFKVLNGSAPPTVVSSAEQMAELFGGYPAQYTGLFERSTPVRLYPLPEAPQRKAGCFEAIGAGLDKFIDGLFGPFKARKYHAAQGTPIRLTDDQLREWRKDGCRE